MASPRRDARPFPDLSTRHKLLAPRHLEHRLATPIRFGDYLQEAGVRHYEVSYIDLQSVSAPTERIRVRPAQAVTILRPYVGPRFLEQLQAVVPLAGYLVLFQVVVLQQPVQGALSVAFALLGAIVGLMLFMEGIK